MPGKFYVERVLKAHAVFVSTTTSRVYLLGGLTDRIEDVLARNRPVGYAAVIDTVLLPFRGGIVWDGIVGLHNVSFGPSIRQTFRDAYLTAKARGEIVSSLDGGPRAAVVPRKGPDRRPAVAEVIRAVEQLGKPDSALRGAAFRLLKPCANLALLTLDDRPDEVELVALLRSTRRALKQVEDALIRRESDPRRSGLSAGSTARTARQTQGISTHGAARTWPDRLADEARPPAHATRRSAAPTSGA